ncbi:MAG: sortase [Acidimicrobiia bacterium]
MRRLVRVSAWTMIWSGSIILGYVGYQLFGTDVVNQQVQAEAQQALPALLEERAAQLELTSSTSVDDQGDPVLIEEPGVVEGEPFAAIRIPLIGVEQVIYAGIDRETLQLGPGHFPGTALPGQPGNAVLSGHRTTYGRPFFDLDLLQPGDTIDVETAVGIHTYTVRESLVVTPFDVWVAEPKDGAWLTITTCHPRFSARERLVVFAELTAGPNFEFVAAA